MRHPNPIPFRNLIRNEGELAIWHSAFGAAFANSASTCAGRIARYNRLTPSEAVAVAIEHDPKSISAVAQLIAQAAVLQYRRIARS